MVLKEAMPHSAVLQAAVRCHLENYGQRYGSWEPTLMPIVFQMIPYLCLFLMAKAILLPALDPCAPERLDNVPVCSDGMALYSAPFRCHVPSGESNRLTGGCSDGREGEMASGMPPSRLHTHPCQGTTATCHPDTPARNVSHYSPLRQSLIPSEHTMSY